ncbi:MAG: PAS domain S-box protein, partial [Chitinophagaceae bacterium]|nr:PAS domain S-box protein [Chitinophagaceae bacterium]
KADDYGNVIEDILEAVGHATGADRVYLFENSVTPQSEFVTSLTHEWCSPSCLPQIDEKELQQLSFSHFEDLLVGLNEGSTFASITDKIDNTFLKEMLFRQRVQSLLIVPLFVNQNFWGFVGLDDCQQSRIWTEMDETVLKTIASSLASSIERKKAKDVIVESEARFKQLADTTPVMIWVSDENDETTYVNKSWAEFTGYDTDQVNSEKWTSLVHQDDLDEVSNEYKNQTEVRKPVSIEYRLRSTSGQHRWVIEQAIPRFLADGTFLGYIGSVIDIHDRKLSEEKLIYQAHVMQQVTEAIISTDLNYVVQSWNKGAEKIYGITEEEIIGKPIRNVLNHRYVNQSREDVVEILAKQNIWTGEMIYQKVDGNEMILQSSLSFMFDNNGEKIGLVGIHRDITAKRKSEEELRRSDERYRSVVEALAEGIVLWDSAGKVIAINKSAQEILKIPDDRGDSSYAASWRYIHEDGTEFKADDFPSFVTRKHGTSFQNIILGVDKNDAPTVWLSINTEPIYYTEQREVPDAVVASFIDISHGKNANAELKRNEQQLREYSDRINSILDSITDGFIAVDKEMRVFLWNKVFETNTGIPAASAIGKKITEVFPDITHSVAVQFQEALGKNETIVLEHYSVKHNMWFETSAFPSMQGLFIYFRDVTKRKRQEFLLALEKEILELNAKPQTSLKVITDQLLTGIEKMFPGIICSVISLQEDGKSIETLSAPCLPTEFSQAIQGHKIGPAAGSCGTAMYIKQNVLVDDIPNSPLWDQYRELAEHYQLQSCWSFPILSSQNKVLASFALYHSEKKMPSAEETLVIERTVNILRVIIENKQSEEKIKVSNERYLLATMATNDAIWDLDVVTNNMYWGEGFHGLFGYKAGYFNNDLGMWEASIHPNDRDRVVQSVQRFISSNSQQIWQDEYRFRTADSKYVLVSDRGFLIYNQQGRVSRMVGSMQDITEKRELEKKLLRQELNKQKLVAQAVVDAQEKERSLIGKELHDNINQILSTAKLYLEVAKTDETDRMNLIEMSTNNISHAINEIRTISRSLVPSSIGDLGIVESIQDLAESIKLTRKLNVEFYYSKGIEEAMTEQQKLMVFRITQEQVNNVMKHANAKNLIIELFAEANMIDISIADDGQGFDLDAVKHKKGVGLSNISSRAELFNGKVKIVTAPGKGCSLNINLPISNQ